MPNPASIFKEPNLPPPGGSPQDAERYINKITALISQDRISVSKTDLSKFAPNALENHYRINLHDYSVEVSHSKIDNGKDSYVIIFSNLHHIKNGASDEAVLAYMHLDDEQYKRFKQIADEQIWRDNREINETRLVEALKPVDELLEELANQSRQSDDNMVDDVVNNSSEGLEPLEDTSYRSNP